MAGAGYKLFNTGDVLTAAQVNTYLQEQAVMRFASAAARTTALSGVLAEGMVSYLMDTNAVEVYDGSAWVGVATGDITAVTAGTGISGGGTSGAVTITNSMATEITAAGDIIVGTGSGTFDNLPIGTTGQVLTADTTVSPYKVKWATASGGGMTLLSTTSVSAQATATISSISSSYTNLQVWVEGLSFTDNDSWLRLAPNGSTTLSNYLQAITTNAGTNYLQDARDGYYPLGKVTSMGQSNSTSEFILNFYNYAGSQAVKIIDQSSYYRNNIGGYGMTHGMGAFVSSSAISSMVFSVPTGTYTATIKIYGVK